MYDAVLLGASNEILAQGYVPHLRKRGMRLLNFSLGACGASVGVYRWLKMPREDLPYVPCLLSYEINDSALLKTGQVDAEMLRHYWMYLVTHTRMAGLVPLILVLPRKVDGKFAGTDARALQLRIASELDVHVLDFTDCFMSIEASGVAASDLMLGNVHMNSWVSEIIGDTIYDVCREIIDAPSADCSCNCKIPDFRLARPSAAPELFLERKTGIFSGEFLSIGDQASFDLNEEEYLSALCLNKGAVGATVSFTGAGGNLTKTLYFRLSPDNAKPSFIVTDIAGRRKLSGTVILDIVDSSISPSELTLHCTKPLTLIGEPNMIEVEYALVGTSALREVKVDFRRPITPKNLATESRMNQVARSIMAGPIGLQQ